MAPGPHVVAQDLSLQLYSSILSEATAFAVSSLRPLIPAPNTTEPSFQNQEGKRGSKGALMSGRGV